MTPKEVLNDRQLREVNNLEKRQNLERQTLLARRESEIKQLGLRPELERLYKQEVVSLQKRQGEEKLALLNQHQAEFQQFEDRRISVNNSQADHIVEQRAVIQTQRREESENTRLNWEGGEKQDRESIMKRLTTVFKKDKGPELDH